MDCVYNHIDYEKLKHAVEIILLMLFEMCYGCFRWNTVPATNNKKNVVLLPNLHYGRMVRTFLVIVELSYVKLNSNERGIIWKNLRLSRFLQHRAGSGHRHGH